MPTHAYTLSEFELGDTRSMLTICYCQEKIAAG
jgi:hypothetical protein